MTGPARLWGAPTPDPSADDGFDFSRRNGGVHAVQLNGSGARDVIPTGAITTSTHPPDRCDRFEIHRRRAHLDCRPVTHHKKHLHPPDPRQQPMSHPGQPRPRGDDNKRHSDVIARERECVSVFDAIGVGGHREAKCRRHRTRPDSDQTPRRRRTAAGFTTIKHV